MDRKLRKILTECIRDIETGARDLEGCLRQHPECAWDLRPHLELWHSLNAAPKAQPNFGGQQRGQQQMLGALVDMGKRGERRMIPFLTPALAKAAAVVAGVALLAGGAAGASAALGGPDVADEVLTTVGITDGDVDDGAVDDVDDGTVGDGSHDDVDDGDVSDSDDGTVDDAGDDMHETPQANREQEMEREQETERSSEGPGDPDESIDHTPLAEREQEMEREQESEGSGNGDDASRNTSGPGH